MNTALITGASSGIGLELAIIHASRGGNLVLVSRNIQKLNSLANELTEKYQVSILVIEKDLSIPGAAKQAYEEVQSKGIKIDYLINNAGFGSYGKFEEQDAKKLNEMIQLNITALTELTRLFLPDMIRNRKGRIMNVASTAAFQPGPLLAVYSATKAYVLSFSEAIANELKNSGITVTAFCPGATESGFQSTANMEESRIVKGKRLPSSKSVAVYGYDSMLKGKGLAIPGIFNKIHTTSVRFVPRKLLTSIARMLMEKKG